MLKFESLKEIVNGKQYADYFIIPDDACEVDIASVSGYVDKCLDDGLKLRNRNVKAMQILDGGPTLKEYIDKKLDLNIVPFLSGMINLLTVVVSFNNANCIHNNIRLESAVFDGAKVRLINWKYWQQIIDGEYMGTVRALQGFKFVSYYNQPIAYAFLNEQVRGIINPGWIFYKTTQSITETLLDLVPKDNNLNDKTETTNIKQMGTLIDEVLEYEWNKKQIYKIVDTFYNVTTQQFDWARYVNLLRRNSDVYGMLSIITFYCFQNISTSDIHTSDIHTRMKPFLKKYMYDVDTFTTPYNTDEIINEFKEIINTTS
jgi:hypothetical protein